MSKPMSVALLLESDGPGGAERMLLQLALQLRELGHRVLHIGPRAGCGWLRSEFSALGFPSRDFSLRRQLDPRCVQDIRRALTEFEATVVHSHEFTMALYGGAAAALCRLPHVITMHGGLQFAARFRRRVTFRAAATLSQALVTVSESSKAKLALATAIPEGRIDVAYNGVEMAAGNRQMARESLAVLPGELLLLAVGNLYPVKGYDILLKALGAAQRRFRRRWKLVIAGRGQSEDELRILASECGVADAVTFLGYRDDVADLLAAADMYLMPSRSEGFPMAVIEAMRAGKAIIASEVGGIPEAISNGQQGLLVPSGDVAALANAIVRLASSDELRASLEISARSASDQRFTATAMCSRYLDIYSRCLRGRAR